MTAKLQRGLQKNIFVSFNVNFLGLGQQIHP